MTTSFRTAGIERRSFGHVLSNEGLPLGGAETLVGTGGILNAVAMDARFVAAIVLVVVGKTFHEDAHFILKRMLVFRAKALVIVEGQCTHTRRFEHRAFKPFRSQRFAETLGVWVSGIL